MDIDWQRAGTIGFLAVLLALLTVGGATFHAAAEVEAGEKLTIEKTLNDISFFAGSEIRLEATSRDDVIAAAGEVISRRLTADTLVLAGGELELSELTIEDGFLAGGDITLRSGTIEDDLTIAGGEIRLDEPLRIGGTVHAFGGELRLMAPIGGKLRAAGGDIDINAPIDGDVVLRAETLTLGPLTVIGGDLTYRAKNVEIDPAATIRGEVDVEEWSEDEEGWGNSPAASAVSSLFALAVIMFLGAGLLAVVVALLLPRLTSGTAERVRTKPLASLGMGLLIGLLGPALMIALGVTIIGLPLSFLLGAIVLVLGPLGLAGIAYGAGTLLRSILTSAEGEPGPVGRIGWTTLGFLVVALLSMIPVLGMIFWLLLALMGFGAVSQMSGRLLAGRADEGGMA
ncbi:hypothetical protein PB2503_07379 [Parvularcula bermudensis HTCC2503]|uniref:DUF8173 domain-containing protein n=1 Tax=Parvularcula bermudensis (strain ATCC BAA-594 / HTCC2503 / KCTC 12087) TaxID=314260 RepID=E0TFD2_PARBH|nr:hypothetical protein [Parvularcula bermudensis]ADM09533.1 hypothetical protein PB2503_07379 [Parvularcula bermudensis HTCC2503]